MTNISCFITISIFQSLGICPSGYALMHGHLYGSGQLDTFNVMNIKECSLKCDGEHSCCSFEYSPSESKCNLNKNCNPDGGIWRDFKFCSKRDESSLSPGKERFLAGFQDEDPRRCCEDNSWCQVIYQNLWMPP